jgi:hypothetical protein
MSVIGHWRQEAGMMLGVAKKRIQGNPVISGALKTCGYNRHNGEKELCQILRLE